MPSGRTSRYRRRLQLQKHRQHRYRPRRRLRLQPSPCPYPPPRGLTDAHAGSRTGICCTDGSSCRGSSHEKKRLKRFFPLLFQEEFRGCARGTNCPHPSETSIVFATEDPRATSYLKNSSRKFPHRIKLPLQHCQLLTSINIKCQAWLIQQQA